MTSANKSLAKKSFPSVENVIKPLVHMSAVHLSRYEALGKFGEHSRSYPMPRATLTHVLCSPNFLHASYPDECTPKYEPIVN